MAEFDCAPVLLIGFNRPERLKAQVDRLRAVKPRRLFVAVDGPRPDRPGEAEIVARTRAAVASVDWPCDLQTRFLDANRGCRFAPPEAISWFLDAAGEGLILEDDCAPTADFLRFASELLRRYRDEPCVGMISGDNFYGYQSDPCASYHFSRHVHIWGWATWRRAWRAYDGTLARYRETADRRHANRSAGYVPRALTVWGNVARRSHAARALGGWIVPFAHWAERRFPALFRI